MGTPILTPLHERRKRERISEEVRKNNTPGQTSRHGSHGGLEKETDTETNTNTGVLYPRDLLIPNSKYANSSMSASQPPEHQPQVYEGKVRASIVMFIRNAPVYLVYNGQWSMTNGQ